MRRIILSLLIVLSMFAFGCSSSGDSNIPPYNDTGINDNIQGDTGINDNVQGNTGINDNIQGDTSINDNVQGDTSINDNNQGDTSINDNVQGDTSINDNVQGDTGINDNVQDDTGINDNVQYVTLKVKSVVTNGATVYVITEDNRLYTWGNNYNGEVGNGSTTAQTTPYEVTQVGKVKSVEVYGNNDIWSATVYAITEDGRLYAWGYNYYGQVGNGEIGRDTHQSIPYEVKEVGTVKSVVTAGSTVYAITEDGRLYSWGYNRYGLVGNGESGLTQLTPYEVTSVGRVKSVEVYGNNDIYGFTVYAITEDGRLYSWGNNDNGEVGNGESSLTQLTPYEVTSVGKVKSVEVYGNNDMYGATVYAITEDGRLYSWGNNRFGQVGNGYIAQTTPYEVTSVGKVKSVEVYGNSDGATVYAITEDGRLYAWGYNYYGQVGNGESGKDEYYKDKIEDWPYHVTEVGRVKSVKVCYDVIGAIAYAITEDGRLYAWGDNQYGLVGNGESGLTQSTPYEVTSVGTVKSVVTDGSTVYAITEDNRLYAWGWNYSGQVGNGYTAEQTTPHEVAELGEVRSVEINLDTVYAITEDNRLYAWGDNRYGQVGNGESGCSNSYDPSSCKEQTTPYEVTSVGKVKSVVSDGFTVYTITEDNRLYAWGNNNGRVGNGTTTNQLTPYEVKEIIKAN